METPGSQVIPDVAPYYGPIYIADLITFGMWSIVCLQTFRYFNKYPKDRIVFKIMVIVEVALLNVELGFIIARGYSDLISNFGNPEPAFRAIPEYAYNLLISTVIAALVQSFLTYRIWIFVGRKCIVPMIFIPMAIFELLAVSIYVGQVLTLGAQAHQRLPLSEVYIIPEQKLMLAYYSVSPVVDMAIAGFMFYYLLKKSNETPFTGSATLLHRLAILSINTGLWTTIIAFLTLILLVQLPGTNYFAIPSFPLGALYVNSCLMNLNSRRSADSHQNSNFGSIGANITVQLATSHQENLVTVTRTEHIDTSMDTEHGMSEHEGNSMAENSRNIKSRNICCNLY